MLLYCYANEKHGFSNLQSCNNLQCLEIFRCTQLEISKCHEAQEKNMHNNLSRQTHCHHDKLSLETRLEWFRIAPNSEKKTTVKSLRDQRARWHQFHTSKWFLNTALATYWTTTTGLTQERRVDIKENEQYHSEKDVLINRHFEHVLIRSGPKITERNLEQGYLDKAVNRLSRTSPKKVYLKLKIACQSTFSEE